MIAVLSTLGCAAGPLGCAATASNEPEPALPAYAPADAALFDDTFSADIFDTAAIEPDLDREKLQERVVLADSVVPARISTITRDVAGDSRAYTLVLTPTGAPLAGQPVHEPIQISVTPRSPSFVRVRTAETTLVGKPLIVMFRRYDVDGTETLHWRAESDTAAVRTAIRQATAVRAGRSEH